MDAGSTRPKARISYMRRSRSAVSRSVGMELNPDQAVNALPPADVVPPVEPLRDHTASAPAIPDDSDNDAPPRELVQEEDAAATASIAKDETVAARVQRYRRVSRVRRPPLVGRYEDVTA
jgi:hypothetical protein